MKVKSETKKDGAREYVVVVGQDIFVVTRYEEPPDHFQGRSYCMWELAGLGRTVKVYVPRGDERDCLSEAVSSLTKDLKTYKMGTGG